MATPTNAQKAAVWLVITMDGNNFRLLMNDGSNVNARNNVIALWSLDPDAVDFVKHKLAAASPGYVAGILAIADGFHNQLVAGDWGDDVCPDKLVTASLYEAVSPRTREHNKSHPEEGGSRHIS